MTALHTVASLHPAAGGPSRTVSSTCSALSDAGIDAQVCTYHQPGEELLFPVSEQERVSTVPPSPFLTRPFRFYRAVKHQVQDRGVDIVHDHGVWLPSNLASAVAARRLDVPFVVTTRGMLEPWALKHQEWKKRLAWVGYQRWILRQAALLHATAPMEADQLRNLDLTAPIAVIPNGVPLPEAYKQRPTTTGRRQALFLSRIHPKKGLPMLIDAWGRVQPPNWELVIVGPSENNHRVEVEAKVEKHGLADVVSFSGPVPDDEKWAVYRESDLFVLPTHSENFGVVVAEALASGIPALTTTGAPWSGLEERDCGWWVEPSVDSLEAALSDAVSRSDDERLAMGQRGRALVEDQFSWASVAKKMNAAYQWLLDEGPRPDFVRHS